MYNVRLEYEYISILKIIYDSNICEKTYDSKCIDLLYTYLPTPTDIFGHVVKLTRRTR